MRFVRENKNGTDLVDIQLFDRNEIGVDSVKLIHIIRCYCQ